MHSSLTQIDHRTWPMPAKPWTWRQSWNQLLFVHYRVDTKDIAHLVPKELKIQEFDGSSWIGIVPFEMNRVMHRGLPNLPWFSYFLELNVRLYVERDGKPGVWFLTLDATNPFVVWLGNKFFNLPYRNASIQTSFENGTTTFSSIRKEKSNGARFTVQHKPVSDVFYAKSGSLEYFLTERYCFYAQSKGKIFRADVHHKPWPLQQVQAKIIENTLVDKIKLSSSEPLVHFSTGVDVINWNPTLA